MRVKYDETLKTALSTPWIHHVMSALLWPLSIFGEGWILWEK